LPGQEDVEGEKVKGKGGAFSSEWESRIHLVTDPVKGRNLIKVVVEH